MTVPRVDHASVITKLEANAAEENVAKAQRRGRFGRHHGIRMSLTEEEYAAIGYTID